MMSPRRALSTATAIFVLNASALTASSFILTPPAPFCTIDAAVETKKPIRHSRDLSIPWRRCGRQEAPTALSALPFDFFNAGKQDAKGGGPARVLVLGGTGLVGSEIVNLLNDRCVPCVATSPTNKDDFVTLDLTSPVASEEVRKLARGCSAVISTVGSIGTPDDKVVNAASGPAAKEAKEAGASRFVFIGNDNRVRSFARSFGPLKGYAEGKDESENMIREAFGPINGFCIVQPTFIYGGENFGLNPPRLPSSIGQIAEDILGLYPIQALAGILPGILGVALEPPVSRERVAAAAVNAALGLVDTESCPTLGSRDDIILAACKRPKKTASQRSKLPGLKERIFNFGDASVSPEKMKEAFDLLEEIETYRPASVRPAYDPKLDGRWDWNFDVEPDAGTGVIKEMLEGRSPLGPVFGLNDVHMEITDQRSFIRIFVSAKILGLPAGLVLTTTLKADSSDPDGTMFQETFEGIKLAGVDLPIPNSWKRSRPLEISYLDEDMFIVRGNGGEPHFLYRNK